MMEKARRGNKRVVVEMELVKGEYNERSETGAFSEPRAPKAGHVNVCRGEMGWGKKVHGPKSAAWKRGLRARFP